MNICRKKPLGFALFLVILLTHSLLPNTVFADEKVSLADVQGKAPEQRLEIYEQLTFDVEFLYVGKVVSHHPLAIVTSFDEQRPRHTAVIRVWTGLFSRHVDDLAMTWDELTVSSDGSVRERVPDIETYIADYFQAEEQSDFYSEDYLGVMPWVANIPTDSEAASRSVEPIADLSTYNMYQLALEGPDHVERLLGNSDEITLLPQVPEIAAALQLPADAASSWAKDYIVHLWKLGIVTGYTDNTIRPEGTLTRSEFIAILTRALQLPLEGSTEYGDVTGTWVEEEVAAAENAGIIPKGDSDSRFRPNEDMTRVEMIEMIYRAIAPYGMPARQEQVAFRDTVDLNLVQSEALSYTTQIGVISGYPDGTFKPQNSLQRAEAFKVISALLQLIQ